MASWSGILVSHKETRTKVVMARKLGKQGHGSSPGPLVSSGWSLFKRKQERRYDGFTRGGWTKYQPDKMLTGQNANWTKCHLKVGVLSGLFLWLAFWLSHFLVGILFGPSQHVLAFYPNVRIHLYHLFSPPCLLLLLWGKMSMFFLLFNCTVWVSCRCSRKLSMVEGRFSKWF